MRGFAYNLDANGPNEECYINYTPSCDNSYCTTHTRPVADDMNHLYLSSFLIPLHLRLALNTQHYLRNPSTATSTTHSSSDQCILRYPQ